MRIWFLKLLFWLQLQAGKLVDEIFKIFNIFAGLEEVTAEGKKTDLLTYFLTNDTVLKVFWSIVVIGVGVSTILTIVALTKSMFTKKKAAQIMGHYAVSVGSMVVVASCVIMFIFLANGILFSVDKSFDKGEDLTVSERIIENCVQPPSDPNLPQEKWDGGWIWYDHKVDQKTEPYNMTKWKAERKYNEDGFFGTWKSLFGFEIEGEVDDDGLKQNVTPPEETKETKGDIGNSRGDDPRYKTNGCVDINKYNFAMGLFATITLLIVALTASMGLISRLFDMIFLLLTSPLIMATIPVDEGAKFKLWRETVVSKVMLAYGSVFAINIFVMCLGLIPGISIVGNESGSQIMRMLLMVCGGLTVSTGQILFSRLIGTSAEESRQMTHGMRQLFGGVMATAGMAKGAGRMVFGTRNQMTGTRERGLFQGMFGGKDSKHGERQGGLARHAMHAGQGGGKLLFGNSYRGPISGIKGKAGQAGSAIKSGWNKNNERGGLVGNIRSHRAHDGYGGKKGYNAMQADFNKSYSEYDAHKSKLLRLDKRFNQHGTNDFGE